MERRVAVTDSVDLLTPAIDRLRDHGVRVEVLPGGAAHPDAARAVGLAPVAIVGVLPFPADAIELLERTRLLIRAGIGYDIIDVPAATAAGIWVANVPDYCIDEVADHALLLLLAAWRRLPELGDAWRGDRWLAYERLPPVHRIAGRRLGIVGFGRIGRAVAARAAAFGWEVVAHDPLLGGDAIAAGGATPVGLEELFRTSDAVTLHAALTPENHHLVDARRLATVRPGLVLVNTSRGGLVDLDALDAAVADGRVAAVGLDVLEGEPDPDRAHPLLARPQVVVTGHVAWYSLEARRDLALLAADEALRYLDGERPRNIVNPEARPWASREAGA